MLFSIHVAQTCVSTRLASSLVLRLYRTLWQWRTMSVWFFPSAVCRLRSGRRATWTSSPTTWWKTPRRGSASVPTTSSKVGVAASPCRHRRKGATRLWAAAAAAAAGRGAKQAVLFDLLAYVHDRYVRYGGKCSFFCSLFGLRKRTHFFNSQIARRSWFP